MKKVIFMIAIAFLVGMVMDVGTGIARGQPNDSKINDFMPNIEKSSVTTVHAVKLTNDITYVSDARSAAVFVEKDVGKYNLITNTRSGSQVVLSKNANADDESKAVDLKSFSNRKSDLNISPGDRGAPAK